MAHSAKGWRTDSNQVVRRLIHTELRRAQVSVMQLLAFAPADLTKSKPIVAR